jgi:hypothetical protein
LSPKFDKLFFSKISLFGINPIGMNFFSVKHKTPIDERVLKEVVSQYIDLTPVHLNILFNQLCKELEE